MNIKLETASSLPFTVRFFIWTLAWSGTALLVGSIAYSSTFEPSAFLYHNMWLRTVVINMALLLTGLLITSGLVAFAEWPPEHTLRLRKPLTKLRVGLDASSVRDEAEKVKEEIELLEREKKAKSLLQELKARRDSLREEVKGV